MIVFLIIYVLSVLGITYICRDEEYETGAKIIIVWILATLAPVVWSLLVGYLHG